MQTATNTAPRRSAKADSALVPWQNRPLVTIQLASEVSGISPTSIYRLAREGRLTLRRLAGRVVVETPGLVKLINSAEPWTPSDQGKAARERRSEIARAAWRR